MRKYLILLLLLWALPVSAWAHPGGTDENGGHWDRENGDYHYHHGYEAHDHTDGVCPFDFDDKTGQNSGAPSSSPSSTAEPEPDTWAALIDGWQHDPKTDRWTHNDGRSYASSSEFYEFIGFTWHEDVGIWTGEYGIINENNEFRSYDDLAFEIEESVGDHGNAPVPEDTTTLPEEAFHPPTEQETSFLESVPLGVWVTALSIILLLAVYALVKKVRRQRRVKAEMPRQAEEEKQRQEAERIRQAVEARIQAEEKARQEEEQKYWAEVHRRNLFALYDNKLLHTMFDVPPELGLDENETPIHLLGQPLTVYITKPGGAYHRGSCRYAQGRPHWMWDVQKTGCHPCGVCHPDAYSFVWYYEYLKAKKELREQGLELIVRDNKLFLTEKVSAEP